LSEDLQLGADALREILRDRQHRRRERRIAR
jgi:hypothetical protein